MLAIRVPAGQSRQDTPGPLPGEVAADRRRIPGGDAIDFGDLRSPADRHRHPVRCRGASAWTWTRPSACCATTPGRATAVCLTWPRRSWTARSPSLGCDQHGSGPRSADHRRAVSCAGCAGTSPAAPARPGHGPLNGQQPRRLPARADPSPWRQYRRSAVRRLFPSRQRARRTGAHGMPLKRGAEVHKHALPHRNHEDDTVPARVRNAGSPTATFGTVPDLRWTNSRGDGTGIPLPGDGLPSAAQANLFHRALLPGAYQPYADSSPPRTVSSATRCGPGPSPATTGPCRSGRTRQRFARSCARHRTSSSWALSSLSWDRRSSSHGRSPRPMAVRPWRAPLSAWLPYSARLPRSR
jgi:hypothetical protein